MHYIKSYPFSIILILVVAYLSLSKFPTLNILLFPGLDKAVHFCMYAGLSGMLWIEFLFNHRKKEINIIHAIVGAMICPILFSGLIELCQQYLTRYRSGDWMDFIGNVSGVLIASLIAWFILRPRIIK